MFPVCPKCRWSPCECPGKKWVAPKPPFEILRKYRTQKLLEHGARIYKGRAYVLVPATTSGRVDVVFEFDPLPGNRKWSCEGVGRRDCSNWEKAAAEGVSIPDLLEFIG